MLVSILTSSSCGAYIYTKTWAYNSYHNQERYAINLQQWGLLISKATKFSIYIYIDVFYEDNRTLHATLECVNCK